MSNASSKPGPAAAADRVGALAVPALLGVFIVIAIYLGSQVAAEFILRLIPGLYGTIAGTTLGQFVYVVLVEAFTLGALYYFLKGRGLSFRSLGLLRPRLVDFGITLLAYPPYFILNAVAALSAAALFRLNTDQAQQTGFEAAIGNTDLLLTFVSLVILPPLVEEIVMRGFLFGSLKNGFKVIPAAIITSVLFAVAHLQFGNGVPLLWLAAIDTFVLSLVLCYLRQKTGSLWAGIGLHCLKNLLAFLVLFIFPKYGLFPGLSTTIHAWTAWLQ